MAVAVKVNGVVPRAGEVLGGLGRWGRGWSPGCSQHPVLSPRVSAAGLGVGVLGHQGTHLFGTLEDLWNPRGAARGAWGGGTVALQAGPGFAGLSVDCLLLGPWWSTSAVT